MYLSGMNSATTSTGSQNVSMFRLEIRVTTEQCKSLLSVSEFATEAGVTPQAVRKMIAEDRLSAERIGEQYVISREELSRYLSSR